MVNIHDAIRALNPNVVTISDLTATDNNGQVVQYNLTQAQAKLVELQALEEAQKQAAQNAKASALAKLTALGLTENEVKALIGE